MVQCMTQTQTHSPAASSAARWAIDASHSTLSFGVRHMMITTVRGEFTKLEGEVRLDPARPEEAAISVRVDTASIHTRDEKRDAHLRSADFFDVERFPTATYVSRAVRRAGDGYEIVGDLTLRGTTRQVVLRVTDVTAEQVDPWGQRRIGASATATIRRSDFGMTWNTLLEAGGVLVGDEVSLSIDVSLVRQPPAGT